MGKQTMIMRLMRIIEATASIGDLSAALAAVTTELGFRHFALCHHVDVVAAGGRAIRLHNYPSQWVDYYDRHALGPTDPVHRASHVTSIGFPWRRIPQMIPLTLVDQRVLALGGEQGLVDGFTVPVHVPGEAPGSCSFVSQASRPISEATHPWAQLAGNFAFEAARRLWAERGDGGVGQRPILTDRQRDCLLWAARGKTDWEIGRILSISEETVARHISHACERYGVNKRSLLMTRALFDGTLIFAELFRWRYDTFPE